MIEKTFADRTVLIFRDMEEISAHIIAKWTDAAEDAIRNKKEFTVALSGGKTPVHLYRNLASRRELPWGKTHVFMVDERFVPYENELNNFRMINESLLLHVNIPARNIHPIITSNDSARDCSAKYEDHIAAYFKLSPRSVPVIDLVLLGIGEDGHTASLFPGSEALSETTRLAVAVTQQTPPVHERITLTFPVINNASYVMVLAAGKNKAGILGEVLLKRNMSLPASMIKPLRGTAVFLADQEAAALLTTL